MLRDRVIPWDEETLSASARNGATVMSCFCGPRITDVPVVNTCSLMTMGTFVPTTTTNSRSSSDWSEAMPQRATAENAPAALRRPRRLGQEQTLF